jgi:hypothetical protein
MLRSQKNRRIIIYKRRVKYFAVLCVVLLPSSILSQTKVQKEKTPSLFDIWTAPAGISGIFAINDSLLIPLDIGILAEKDSNMQRKVQRGGKKAHVLQVVYDSAKAKGRIIVGHGLNRGIGYILFHIRDNGEASFHLGTLRNNGGYKSMEEAIAASARDTDRYAFHRLSNSALLKKLEQLKDLTKISPEEAIELCRKFRDHSIELLRSSYHDSLSMHNLWHDNKEKLQVDWMLGEYFLNDFFVRQGYNPRTVLTAYHQFQNDPPVAREITNALKGIWEIIAHIMNPWKYSNERNTFRK